MNANMIEKTSDTPCYNKNLNKSLTFSIDRILSNNANPQSNKITSIPSPGYYKHYSTLQQQSSGPIRPIPARPCMKYS